VHAEKERKVRTGNNDFGLIFSAGQQYVDAISSANNDEPTYNRNMNYRTEDYTELTMKPESLINVLDRYLQRNALDESKISFDKILPEPHPQVSLLSLPISAEPHTERSSAKNKNSSNLVVDEPILLDEVVKAKKNKRKKKKKKAKVDNAIEVPNLNCANSSSEIIPKECVVDSGVAEEETTKPVHLECLKTVEASLNSIVKNLKQSFNIITGSDSLFALPAVDHIENSFDCLSTDDTPKLKITDDSIVADIIHNLPENATSFNIDIEASKTNEETKPVEITPHMCADLNGSSQHTFQSKSLPNGTSNTQLGDKFGASNGTILSSNNEKNIQGKSNSQSSQLKKADKAIGEIWEIKCPSSTQHQYGYILTQLTQSLNFKLISCNTIK
jgi:hypothetical protein